MGLFEENPMCRKGSLAVVLCLVIWTSIANATPVWTNVDSSFTINNPLDTTPANPKAYTISVTNSSANSYTNVHFIIPFHWIVNAIPATSATASTWDNSVNKDWVNGATTLKMTDYTLLTAMSDTDIFASYPATGLEQTTGVPATINAADTVPNYYVGNFAPGDTLSFTVTIAYDPAFVKSNFLGYFVVPEPGALALSVLSALGLLRRRRVA
jgi:hypothetical protein